MARTSYILQNQVEIFARSNATQIVQTDVNGGYRVSVRPGHYYVISRCPLGLGLKVLSWAGPVNVWGGFQSLDLHGGDTSNRDPDDLLSS